MSWAQRGVGRGGGGGGGEERSGRREAGGRGRGRGGGVCNTAFFYPGSQWKAWEDRAFVKEVLAVKPFNCTVQLNSLHHRKEVRVWNMWAVTAVGTQVKGGSTS